MEEKLYGIEITVEGAPSGSDRLGNQQGQTMQDKPNGNNQRRIVKPRSAIDLTIAKPKPLPC